MGLGVMVECDWCQEFEMSYHQKTASALRRWLNKNDSWKTVRTGNKVTLDFCCQKCYENWKDDQTKQKTLKNEDKP